MIDLAEARSDGIMLRISSIFAEISVNQPSNRQRD